MHPIYPWTRISRKMSVMCPTWACPKNVIRDLMTLMTVLTMIWAMLLTTLWIGVKTAANHTRPPRYCFSRRACCCANWVVFFPTCQVRVVRFYVSTGPPSSSSSSFSSSCRPPQLRSCEFSVACWTPTAILWVQCGVLDPNRDPASAVWRAGPQLRSCEFSVAGRTPTVISWVQCCVPDLNCDSASSVWRAGPQLRLCEFSVACRTSPVMERIGSSCRKSVSKK